MVLNFGKFKGKTLEEILDLEPPYIIWLDEAEIIIIPTDIIRQAVNLNQGQDLEDIHSDWDLRD
jgi:uncharacterized protein (DUF3820 family)